MDKFIDEQKLFENFLNGVKDDIALISYQQNRVATGKTIASIKVQTGSKIGGRILANENILNTEFGTSAEDYMKIPFYTLLDAITDWVKIKNMPLASAKPITINLRQSGSKLYREGGNSGVLSNSINKKRFDNFSNALANAYLQQASSIIFK